MVRQGINRMSFEACVSICGSNERYDSLIYATGVAKWQSFGL